MYPTPQIRYDAGAGTVTVRPTYPNVTKPMIDDVEALRHDSITSFGIRQSMLERVDRIKPVVFDHVPWSDMPMWEAFFSYAVQGGTFQYFPDGSATAFQTFELVDDKVKPAFVAFGLSKFTINLRVVPGGASSP